MLPAAIYPFHNDHCLGCCISAMPTRLFGRLRLYQQSHCNCQQPSHAAGRHTVAAAPRTPLCRGSRPSPRRSVIFQHRVTGEGNVGVRWSKGHTPRRRDLALTLSWRIAVMHTHFRIRTFHLPAHEFRFNSLLRTSITHGTG